MTHLAANQLVAIVMSILGLGVLIGIGAFTQEGCESLIVKKIARIVCHILVAIIMLLLARALWIVFAFIF